MLTITGLMRSGTSLTAQTANAAGVVMGTQMLMPAFGLRPEWEDTWLSTTLAVWALTDKVPDFDLLSEYVRSRVELYEHSKEMWRVSGWGAKCPLLMLYWDEWKQAVGDSENHVVVITDRPISETLDSIERVVYWLVDPAVYGEEMPALQGKLQAAYERVRADADLVVSYKDMVSNAKATLAPAIEMME